MAGPLHVRRALGRALAAALSAVALSGTTLFGSLASAADIPRLQGTITDQVGVIGDGAGEVLTALDDVLAEQGVQVFVLFVRTTADLTVTEFVDEAARENSLGGDDALLLVATDDRTDAIWVSNALPISDEEINGVISDTLEPGLREGDFARAVIDAARALGAAAGPDAPATAAPSATPPPVPSESGGGSVDLVGLVGIVLVGLGIVAVLVWVAARLGAWRETGERDRRLARLARDANAKLIAADDRVRAAEQETGFVEAEFGETEASPFRAAVSEAKRELRAAFALRQRLDDNDPEDPPTRETMLNQIVEATGRADAALDAQAAHVEQLRSLERDAPRILAGMAAQVEPVEARLAGAEATLASLAVYAPSSWQAVRGNATEARKGLAGARDAIERGTAVATTDGPKAAREIVVAQRGIAGATALLDAIDKLATTIRTAADGLPGDLEAAEHDLAEARRAIEPRAGPAVTASGMSTDRKADLTRVAAALSEARSTAGARPLDPIDAARQASAARAQATQLLANVRDDVAQAARFAAAVDAAITAAQTEVDRAADFIATRRTGVARRARTRLAEAERLLASAVSVRHADPKSAMTQAQRADQLAGEAYSLASTDFASWDAGRRPTPSGSGSDLAGAILGGIIGGILSGGGRGAGWGGSPWGSPGSGGMGGPFGGSGGGWGGGHSAGGGFGGFGGSGGGGGGHSQGGRW